MKEKEKEQEQEEYTKDTQGKETLRMNTFEVYMKDLAAQKFIHRKMWGFLRKKFFLLERKEKKCKDI